MESQKDEIGEYPHPQKTEAGPFGFIGHSGGIFSDGEHMIMDKIYDGFIDESEYPSEKTVLEVKRLCQLDPQYCMERKFKEKYHKLFLEIKKTSSMIEKINASVSDDNSSKSDDTGCKDIYEIDEYIDLVNGKWLYNYSNKRKFDDEITKLLKEHIDSKFCKRVFVKGSNGRYPYYPDEIRDMSWSDFEEQLFNPLDQDIFKTFIFEFGVKLHSTNQDRYYPFIVEKIKQKLLREYFM